MQEFDVAFHHNIMVKRKKRLIVLMALDSPTDLYANDASDTAALRQYLRQYTYIDYMADDWLDNIIYALPLRGLLQSSYSGMNHDIEGENPHDIQPLLMGEFRGEHMRFNNASTDVQLML